MTLPELRALLDAATKGPWRAEKWDDDREQALIYMDTEHPEGWRWGGWVSTRTRDNAALIVAAVNAIPRLLAIIEAADDYFLVRDEGNMPVSERECRAAYDERRGEL